MFSVECDRRNVLHRGDAGKCSRRKCGPSPRTGTRAYVWQGECSVHARPTRVHSGRKLLAFSDHSHCLWCCLAECAYAASKRHTRTHTYTVHVYFLPSRLPTNSNKALMLSALRCCERAQNEAQKPEQKRGSHSGKDRFRMQLRVGIFHCVCDWLSRSSHTQPAVVATNSRQM